MHNNTSPKAQKLLQFRDKLAKINGSSNLSSQRQKLKEIINHNKIIQSDISAIFDEISEHYLKWENQIITVCNNIKDIVEFNQKSLLKQLQILKEKELDTIKEDVDQYIGFQKKVKKLSIQLDNSKTKKQILMESINKIKPFNTKKMYQKMQNLHPDRQRVHEQIKKIYKIQQIINNLIDKYQLQYTSEKQKDKNSPKNSKKINDLFQSRSHSKKKLNERVTKILDHQTTPKTGNKQINVNKYRLDTFLKEEKVSERQSNLISQSQVAQKNDQQKIFQFNGIQSLSPQVEENDEKTQKLVQYSSQGQKKFHLSRQKSHPTIGTSQLKYSIDKFLFQLKNNDKKNEDQFSSRQQVSIAIPPTKINKLSRVKSQQNLFTQNKSKLKRHSDNIQVPIQSPRIKRLGEKTITSYNTIQTDYRINESKNESRNGKRGNWACILKQQQTKYNQMRKKLKN